MQSNYPNFQTGQLIRSSATQNPFVDHYGVILVDRAGSVTVLHNKGFATPKRTPINEYLLRRKFVRLEDSPLVGKTVDQILTRYDQVCKHQAFSLFGYNCEHFVDCMTGQTLRSEQMIWWGLFLGAILIGSILLYLKLKSKTS